MKLTTDRLIIAITKQIDPYEPSDGLKILREDYGFTDDEIREMGFDYLFDLTEEPEPKEPPKKTFTVRIVEQWAGTFEIEAKDEDEAYDLACDLDYNSDELGLEDRDIYVYDDPAAAEM